MDDKMCHRILAKKTMSIGGATYDLFVRTSADLIHKCDSEKYIALPLGGKVPVKGVIETCGGGASNTSVGLSRLGCKAFFAGVIGSDQWGEKLLQNLKKEGVNTDCATVVEREVSSFSIILSASGGERTILYTPGANVHLHDANFCKEEAMNTDWIYLNHIQKFSSVILDDIMDAVSSEDGPGFTWNPGGCQLETGMDDPENRKLLYLTDLLLLNAGEAMKFAKTDSIDSALKLLVKYGAKNVCITHGNNGTIASDGSNTWHCPCLSGIEVVDTTGAGDAFGTGATWALLSDKGLQYALKAGTINAASVVSKIGAQEGLLTDTEMRKRLELVDLNVRTIES